MISWIKALWAAVMAFFASRKEDQQAAQMQAQEVQDQIVEEAQNEIEDIPNRTDAELFDTAVSTGLVQPEGANRPDRLGTGNSNYSGRPPGASLKTKY